MASPCLAFENLTLGYNSHPAVHHLEGAVQRGTALAVVGSNGSGKSTLMKGIAGLIAPISGAVRVAPGVRLAYLPQQSELDRSFPARVADIVAMGLWPRRGLLGRRRPADREAVAAALNAVGLAGFGMRGIGTLSGGQFQRALFARVILQDAELILLDEPFNAVDARTVGDLVALIHRWCGEGRTVVLVAHDLELVRAEFPETLLLARRPVAWGPTAAVLTAANLAAARHFHEAWDEAAPWCRAHDETTAGPAHTAPAHHHHRHEHSVQRRGAA